MESDNSEKIFFDKRAIMYSGVANLQDIFQAELSGRHLKDVHNSLESSTNVAVFESLEFGSLRNGEMLVTGKIVISQSFKYCADISQVSDFKKTRDCLKVLV